MGISTFDQIFTTRQILEKYWEENIDVHKLCIDCQAACDTEWRKEVRSEMHKVGFPKKKLVELCRILNNAMYAKVKIGVHLLNLKLTKS